MPNCINSSSKSPTYNQQKNLKNWNLNMNLKQKTKKTLNKKQKTLNQKNKNNKIDFC
jgi:Asp-tRNA(Asn)/Glu-tRNA(Gln) amidotransferase B subunit